MNTASPKSAVGRSREYKMGAAGDTDSRTKIACNVKSGVRVRSRKRGGGRKKAVTWPIWD